jgi:hypothetical protein
MSSSELPTPAAAAPLGDRERREIDRELVKKEHKRTVGRANFEAAKAKAGGLSALEKTEAGRKWLQALIPKEDKEGAALNDTLNACLNVPDFFDDDDRFEDFQHILKKAQKFYYDRVGMYTDVFLDPQHGRQATEQICTLAGILDATFKQGYNNIFETWIQVGDAEALSAFARWAEDEGAKLKDNLQAMQQSSTDLGSCYANACDKKLTDKYRAFLRRWPRKLEVCLHAPRRNLRCERWKKRRSSTKRRFAISVKTCTTSFAGPFRTRPWQASNAGPR